MLYQVYCESDNNKVISALYQASNDKNARDKIRSYVRDSVTKYQISWLITIHRSDYQINFDDLHLKSPQSIKLKKDILSASTVEEFTDWIWIKEINIIDSSLQDPDIVNILDHLQDNDYPEVIEITPCCILFPDENEGGDQNKSPKNYPKCILLGGNILNRNNEETIDNSISLNISQGGDSISLNVPHGNLRCAKWFPGKPCIAMTRVLENFSK